jgi:hypothetical protein
VGCERLIAHEENHGSPTLAERVLRDGDFCDRGDLADKIEAFTILHDETAKPYRWTYDGAPLKAA